MFELALTSVYQSCSKCVMVPDGVLQYIRSMNNFRAEQPHQHAVYYTSMIVSEQLWTKEELLDAAEGTHSLRRLSLIGCNYLIKDKVFIVYV